MEFWIIPLILATAYMYSSVGHGGATGYLAIMSLFGIGIEEMRTSALILNLIVSSIATIQFASRGYFKFRLFLPFAAASIPLAYLGSTLKIDSYVYHIILGLCLIISAGWIALRKDYAFYEIKKNSVILSFIIGGIIGFVSGIIGIGGGILLSPVVFLLHWANMKETAAVSALFILVNSAAGLTGIASTELTVDHHILIWIGAAFAGGVLGSYAGSFKFKVSLLRNILAIVLAIAGSKLILM